MPISPPNRATSGRERKRLTEKVMLAEQRADCPDSLNISDIQQAPNLFQPRYESIAYAPGRSDAHITNLAQIARSGRALDPVTIMAFGTDWLLIDGHHRLAAYAAAKWKKPVPVIALHSDLCGAERVEWAVQQSYADNKKNRLSLSAGDKADGAWGAVAREAKLSIAETAEAHGVSKRNVATMREVRRGLVAGGGDPLRMSGWRMAKMELKRLQDREAPSANLGERQRRILAKHLAPVMGMQVTPGQLAEALEAFAPGIVEAMALAYQLDDDGDLDDTEDGI